MRIVEFVETLNIGGLEKMVINLAVEQASAGHQVRIYCLFGPGKLAGEARERGIEVTAFDKKPGFSISKLLAIAAAMRSDRPDVVHSHNPFVHHYAAMAAKLARCPVIVNTRHGPITSEGKAFNERYFRCVLPLTDHVVHVSEDCRRTLSLRLSGRQNKHSVILNGISLEPFMNQKAQVGSHFPRLRFGTVGRMVPVKAHSILIDAFRLVLEKLPTAELQIVGGGPLMNELQTQIDKFNLARKVQLKGPSNDISGVLSTWDIFVLPSLNEGLPLVVLEAMAAGLPIVATRVGGVPEVAQEGTVAWYCEPNDPNALANTLLTAALGRELATRGAAAREIAMEKFGIFTMYQHYDDLFRRIIQHKGTA